MTWGLRARRRADDFDTLVELSSTGAARHADHARDTDARDAQLLELVGALRGVPAPQPRPEFVAALRSRLMAEAESALVPDDAARLRLPARRTSRERRIAAVVGGLAIAGATTSVAVASQSALPGESLYPIKRIIESAHTGLSLGEQRKGSTELANASSRLDEVTALTQDSDLGDDERIASTLGTFTEQATAGADLLLADYAHTGRASSIATLRDFASSSMDRLIEIEPQIPYAARDELIAAANTLAQIDAEAEQQCATCGGTPITSIPLPFAAETIDLPAVPSAQPINQSDIVPGKGKRDGTKHSTDQGNDPTTDPTTDPALPEVDGAVPPGSVLDPADPTPSGTPNPVKDLTDGLTGVLTGKDPSGSKPPSGASPTASPLNQVVDGVDGILHGVLDPVTGLLLPGSKPTP
ncbi:hypothetical protein GCM10023350_00910 [Nocardioides endophyticus]|uniref:DUF5667 domain-containing protein n=1 Tax=Nocardioides endophyticus TaxID=1353775 RepID=A0ABP8YAS7_9ACTN